MKQNLGVILVCGAALLSGIAFSQSREPAGAQAPPQAGPDRLERLEKDLVDSRARVEALAVELAATQTKLAEVVGYLQANAASAKGLEATLDASEEAGFTFGINPESRHILLRGWREHLAALGTAVPKVPPAPRPAAAKAAPAR